MADSNVVPFQPRPQREQVPDLECVEMRLNLETCNIEMTVRDTEGECFVLLYRLASVPEGFDIDRLAKAWESWRGRTGLAY